MELFIVQLILGLQQGMTLLLVASGLTLIFGTLGVINLAHGVMFTVGAYSAAVTVTETGNFWLGVLAAVVVAAIYGLLLEFGIIRWLYNRDHLDQVLATFGVLLATNQGIEMLVRNWDQGDGGGQNQTQFLTYDAPISGSPSVLPDVANYRFFIVAVGVGVMGFLWFLINRTRVGMWIRAGAEDREMASALGINLGLLFPIVFTIGAILAGLAGAIQGPIDNAVPGIGDRYLIECFVVIVLGGIGSVKGAVIASLLVGVVKTLAGTYLDEVLELFLEPAAAGRAGAAFGSISIFLLMAIVLAIKPEGFFGRAHA